MEEGGPKTIWQKIDSATVPMVNLEVKEVRVLVWEKLQEPTSQRKLILVIVCIALLLDNMLYMVIVPIIPDYLRYIGAWGEEAEDRIVTLPAIKVGNQTIIPTQIIPGSKEGQESATGMLFASKAIVQLMINPFSGALIDRIGYDIPMMIGLIIMFLSTSIFACGGSYGMLFFARSLQGVGSAFADTAGLAMIADRFTEENERSKALGIALAFISFGCLVAPPFGGALYQFAGKEVPFLILAFLSLIDGFMLLIVMKPLKEQMKDANMPKPPSVPIWRLLMDPYIAVCAGALMMANVPLAFLEPTISIWMEDNITKDNWKIGMIWLPAFFPHVFGVVVTVKMAKKYPQHQWLMAAVGLALEGLCCFIIPFTTSYVVLTLMLCGICFGIALIDTALLPTLGYLVDVRYVSVYGSIYAIADISYSFAYAIGPVIAGEVEETIGFTGLNLMIAFGSLAYAPVLAYLRHIYDFKPFENEANILMADPPDKEYQTYSLQEQRPVSGEFKNHLEYGNIQESNVDATPSGYNQSRDSGGYRQGYDPGYEQQGYQNQQPEYQNYVQEQQPTYHDQGWKESIMAIPRRLLGNAPGYTKGYAEGDATIWDLPKLPVPTLQQTIDAYLAYAEIIVSGARMQRTRTLARALVAPGALGHELQAKIEAKREQVDNWVLDWWQDDMYYKVRKPLPINSNPGMVFPSRSFASATDVARVAAILIDGVVDYKEMLDRGELVQERAASREKGQPLCMTQFYRLLNSCRIPEAGRDRIECSARQPDQELLGDPSRDEEYVIIACNNHMYVIPVKASDRGRLSVGELRAQVLLVLADASVAPRAPHVTLLTAGDRDTWATAREVLAEDEGNRRNLDLISRALCLVCLDSEPSVGAEPLLQMMHGGGSTNSTPNRWFDKTLQFIISKNGYFGLCYEHSPAEGIAVIRLAEELVAKVESPAHEGGAPPALLPPPERLQWFVEPKVERAIAQAAREIDRLINDLDLKVYHYGGYGKDFMKTCKVSPDVYIQLALQYAYYKMYGCLVSTYESASLRRFRRGRVDNIRSAHSAARAWAAAMCAQDDSPTAPASPAATGDDDLLINSKKEQKKVSLFSEAARKQTEVMVANILGAGIDNHLLGLREAAREICTKLPEFFTDPTFNTLMEFKLSTSQVATGIDGTYMGYGPVVPDGYGASYNPKKDSVIFCLSSFTSSDVTNTEAFKQSLEEALDAMKLMFERGKTVDKLADK